MTLFSERLYEFTEKSIIQLKAFIDEISCDGIQDVGDDWVEKQMQERLVLAQPSVEEESFEKDLEPDGRLARYAHRVENSNILRFQPSQFAFGGWPFKCSIEQDRLVLWVEADGNPPAKTRHVQIVQQIRENVAALRRDIEQHNSKLRQIIGPLLKRRQQRCHELEERRSQI